MTSDAQTLALLTWLPKSSSSLVPTPAGAHPSSPVRLITGSWRLISAQTGADGTLHLSDQHGALRGERIGTLLQLTIGAEEVRGQVVGGRLILNGALLLGGMSVAFRVWQALPPPLVSAAVVSAFKAAMDERAAFAALGADLAAHAAPPSAAALLPAAAELYVTHLQADLSAVSTAAATACQAPATFAAALGRFTAESETSPDPLAPPSASPAALVARDPVARDLARAERAIASAHESSVVLERAGAGALSQPWAPSASVTNATLQVAQRYVQALAAAARQMLADLRAFQRQAAALIHQTYQLAATVHC